MGEHNDISKQSDYLTNQANKFDQLGKVEQNQAGGRQSSLYDFDRFLLEVVPQLRQVLERGAVKYDDDLYNSNWKLIPAQEHLDHALVHLWKLKHHTTIPDTSTPDQLHRIPDEQEQDALHAAIRALFYWWLTVDSGS